jgi:hypothetical protein
MPTASGLSTQFASCLQSSSAPAGVPFAPTSASRCFVRASPFVLSYPLSDLRAYTGIGISWYGRMAVSRMAYGPSYRPTCLCYDVLLLLPPSLTVKLALSTNTRSAMHKTREVRSPCFHNQPEVLFSFICKVD